MKRLILVVDTDFADSIAEELADSTIAYMTHDGLVPTIDLNGRLVKWVAAMVTEPNASSAFRFEVEKIDGAYLVGDVGFRLAIGTVSHGNENDEIAVFKVKEEAIAAMESFIHDAVTALEKMKALS